jgi:hypothetical protein
MVFLMVYHQNDERDTIMSIPDTTIRNTKPAAKPFKLTDEKGLYLYVMPAGGKYWRMQYRFTGK